MHSGMRYNPNQARAAKSQTQICQTQNNIQMIINGVRRSEGDLDGC